MPEPNLQHFCIIFLYKKSPCKNYIYRGNWFLYVPKLQDIICLFPLKVTLSCLSTNLFNNNDLCLNTLGRESRSIAYFTDNVI